MLEDRSSQVILSDYVVVVSDLHIGDPTTPHLDNFDQDEKFAELILGLSSISSSSRHTLVINGDFVDFARILPKLAVHNLGAQFGVREEDSLARLNRAIDGHPHVFESLRNFLKCGNQILLTPGNHDLDWYWPSVFRYLQSILNCDEEHRLSLVKSGIIDERRIYIEHGNQYSFDNSIEVWGNPILTAPDGSTRLARPWGTWFMDSIFNEIEELYPFANKVRPSERFIYIALHSLMKRNGIQSGLVAKIIRFLLLHGKRMTFSHILGEMASNSGKGENEDLSIGIQDISAMIGITLGTQELADLSSAILKLEPLTLEPSDMAEGLLGNAKGRELPRDSKAKGLLGNNDVNGLRKREFEIFKRGTTDIIVFGHTHLAIDGDKSPLFGQNSSRRCFNTGSWIPSIIIQDKPYPFWEELATYKYTYDLCYLEIKLSSSAAPIAKLQRL